MKFNLYVPNSREFQEWQKYAEKEHRSLSQFIRLAVRDRIQKHKDSERKETA